MDISKLRKGQKIKNYKELCELLGEKVMFGNSKKYQIINLANYCKFHREGRAYIIDEILIVPKERVTRGNAEKSKKGRRADYVESVELLMLSLISSTLNRGYCNGNKVNYSKNYLFELLRMVNENYKECMIRQKQFGEYSNMDSKTVHELFSNTSKMLKRNLESSLNELMHQNIIIWKNEICVAEIIGEYQELKYKEIIDENGLNKKIVINEQGRVMNYELRIAQPNEESSILKYETDIMLQLAKKMNVSTMSTSWFTNMKKILYTTNQYEHYQNLVDSLVLDNLKIGFYYRAYGITVNDEENMNRALENYKLLESEETKDYYEKIVNQGVQKRIITNAKGRKSKTNSDNLNLAYRLGNNYLPNVEKFNKLLISSNATNFSEELIEKYKKDNNL